MATPGKKFNALQPNIWQIRSELQKLHDVSTVMSMTKEPPGITQLYEAIKLSRKVAKKEMTYEEAEAKLVDKNSAVFQWKPFSELQLEVIDHVLNGDPHWILLLEGAVRSGKTIAATAAWLLFVIRSKYPRHLLTGKTKDTLLRNILSDIFDVLGEGNFTYNKSEGILHFMGKTVWCLGANDERSESRFRGPTVGSWYGDEVTTYPDSVMKMAVSRPSIPGAKIFWTTNPDSPYHPVYTEYMTNPKMIEENTIQSMHFTLENNLTLDNRYTTHLKSTYSGLWYDRFILGLWTVAEGAIYDMFIESEHTFASDKQPFAVYDDYTVGVDYATASVCCFTLMGIKKGEVGYSYHFLKEWYYDARVAKRSKADGEYVEDMKEFIGSLPVSRIFMPHDAASMTVALRQKGFVVSTLDPDVVNELKIIGNMFRDGKIMISHECENLIKQMMTYVWDQQAQALGVDAPAKVDDHAVDSMRYNIIGYMTGPRIPNPKLVVPGAPCYMLNPIHLQPSDMLCMYIYNILGGI